MFNYVLLGLYCCLAFYVFCYLYGASREKYMEETVDIVIPPKAHVTIIIVCILIAALLTLPLVLLRIIHKILK